MIKSEDSSSFIDSFWYAWENARNNKFDSSKNILLQSINDNKRIGITFFSIGAEKFKDSRFYEILSDEKQLQNKLDIVLLIAFIGSQDKSCQIDWIYSEKEYAEDEKYYNLNRAVLHYTGEVQGVAVLSLDVTFGDKHHIKINQIRHIEIFQDEINNNKENINVENIEFDCDDIYD